MIRQFFQHLLYIAKAYPFAPVLALLVAIILITDPTFPDTAPVDPYAKAFTGQVTVVSTPKVKPLRPRLFKHSATVSINDSKESKHSKDKVLAIYTSDPFVRWLPGDVLDVSGRISPTLPNANHSGFNYSQYLLRRNVDGFINTKTSDITLQKRDLSFHGQLTNLRFATVRYLHKHLEPTPAALACALFIGVRDYLPHEESSTFRQTGTAHLLAISGLHIGILYGVLYWLLGFILPWQRQRLWLLTVLVLAYIVFTGAQAPVLRAGSVLILGGIGIASARQVCWINLICCAATIVLLTHPTDLFNVGFYLSFSAVTGIVLSMKAIAHQPLDGFLPWQQAALKYCVVAIAAWAFTLPFITYAFHTLSLTAPIYNILVVPLFGIFLITALALLLLSTLITPLWSILNVWLQSLLDVMTTLATLDPGPSLWASPPRPLIFLWLLALILLLNRKLKYGALCLTLALTLFTLDQQGTFTQGPNLRLSFLNVGRGDSTLIETKDHLVIVDAGGFADATRDAILHRRRRHIDALVVTHSDLDHAEHIATLIKHFPVKQIIVPHNLRSTPALSFLDNHPALTPVKTGDTTTLGNLTLLWLNPPNTSDYLVTDQNENDFSLAALVSYNNKPIALLPADIESRGKKHLLKHLPTHNIPIVKAPHHGRNTFRSPAFIKTLNAQTVIINGFTDPRFKALQTQMPNINWINTRFTGEYRWEE